jgi:hypothetical protein
MILMVIKREENESFGYPFFPVDGVASQRETPMFDRQK